MLNHKRGANFSWDEALLALTGALRNHTDQDPDYPFMPYGKDSKRALLVKAILSKDGVKRVSFLMPASLITLPILAISDFIVAANCSGELPTVSTPAFEKLLFHISPC